MAVKLKNYLDGVPTDVSFYTPGFRWGWFYNLEILHRKNFWTELDTIINAFINTILYTTVALFYIILVAIFNSVISFGAVLIFAIE